MRHNFLEKAFYCKIHNYLYTTNQRQMRVRHLAKSTPNALLVFGGFGFLTEPCLFSPIDAVRKPHLPGSVPIFSDFTKKGI